MPHDKNGVELKAGDRVTVECVVEEVSATPDHCNVKLKTVEPFHPNKDGNTSWFNTKQVVKVGLVVLAVLLCSSLAGAADPPKFTVESKLEPRFVVVEKDVSDLKARVARLEAKGLATAACPCPDGGKCVCDPVCPCESKVSASPPAKGTIWLVKGYCGGVECWIPEGYQMEGWSRTPPVTSAVQWDCSSGVCRPVSGASYSAPVYSGGSCAGGSCGAPAASYGGGFGFFGRRR